MKTTTKRILVASAVAGAVVATGYHLLGYAIGIIYGGAMKAHRAATEKALAAEAKKQPIPKPHGWATDNFNLGKWQGESTAGMAVIGVLTIEPNRVRWGNQANGICDSDYSVENLPWGQNGTYPGQLVPPSKPTDLVYAVTRLILDPKPCSTGDAVIQLAVPLDGSNSMEVITYDAKGNQTGDFGTFRLVKE